MSQRIYSVLFEQFIDGAWQRNMFRRDVAIYGGAEQAIKVAMQRERKENGPRRIRAEQVTLVAEEN